MKIVTAWRQQKTGVVVTLVVAAALVIFAAVHRQLIDTVIYTQSWATSLIILPFLSLFCLGVVHLVLGIVRLLKRDIWGSGVNLLMAVISILVCLVAMAIDAPTLLYLT